jgi:hypothetical protein
VKLNPMFPSFENLLDPSDSRCSQSLDAWGFPKCIQLDLDRSKNAVALVVMNTLLSR